MCGIYGRIALASALDADDCLRRTNMLHHRGPDYCGSRVAGNVFLGHARLSILDLTAAGNQPFVDDDGATLIYNGEIYNWRELHDRYLADYHQNSRADTEVLFQLLKRMGTDCLPLLNGMFAFAYYTPATRSMILARDTVGIKPLNFVSGPSHFEFSSEIKNLDYTPDLNRLKEYMVFSRFGDDFLPFANVDSVAPGNFVRVDCATGKWTQTVYREVESLVSRERYERLAAKPLLVDDLDQLLRTSLALHEQSDAPIGFLCSGGLDSSLITAMAAKSHPDIALYHADFEGEGGEAHYARQVADYVGAPINETRITKQQFWELFPEVTYALDLPVQQPTSVSLALIAGKARDDGLKVLLSGEGADELFGGYSWHRSYMNSLSNYSSRWSPSNLVSRVVRKFLSNQPDSYLYFKYARPELQRHAHVGFGFGAWGLDEPVHGLSLVGQDFQAWPRWQQALRSYEWMSDRKEADVQSFMLSNMRVMMQPLLHRLDRMLMIHSIEGRVPFLENAIFDFALNLGLNQKIRGSESKRLLKQVALRYLPASVVTRRKMGFHVPWSSYSDKFPKILQDGFISEWTRLSRKDLESWCHQNPDQRYKLIATEVWGRIFVHKQRWQDVRIEF
ncbi:MAG TPA: asparagine synthase (glutamine-hydrolyzing) [Gemmatimonadaceae bacterium]|nr:asparagine synthase (glutamine-hydrolyzing) [Gemmatimonadaceae bacterium]